jgi:hypothetical protein
MKRTVVATIPVKDRDFTDAFLRAKDREIGFISETKGTVETQIRRRADSFVVVRRD